LPTIQASVRILVRVSRIAVSAALIVLGLLVAGCGKSGVHPAANATVTSRSSSAPCRLTRAQRRTVVRVLGDIGRLRRLEAPMQTYSQHGTQAQLILTGKVEVDLGSSHLPPNVFSHLLHLAKTASRLCGDCGTALEAEEPVLGNRTGTPDGVCG
jgi:hypothetical protein